MAAMARRFTLPHVVTNEFCYKSVPCSYRLSTQQYHHLLLYKKLCERKASRPAFLQIFDESLKSFPMKALSYSCTFNTDKQKSQKFSYHLGKIQ